MNYIQKCFMLLLFLASDVNYAMDAPKEEETANQSNESELDNVNKKSKTQVPPLTGTNRIELETLRLQANKELPKGLYIVPWQTKKRKKAKSNQQRLVLYSLYGDLYEPLEPKSN